MSIFYAIILGIIQALTEFFPISSSAHLSLAEKALGLSSEHILIELACHLGTLCSLLFFLRKDLHEIFFLDRRKLLPFFIALLPLPPLYILLRPLLRFTSNQLFLGPCLVITGAILLAAQFLSMTRSEKESTKRKKRDPFLIGSAQCAALLPGISRSASTIACARWLGWSPKEAVRFSFLLSIPTILGGNCLELLRAGNTSIYWEAFCSAFLASFLVGLLVVKKALVWLEKGKCTWCGFYCITLGLFVTIYFSL